MEGHASLRNPELAALARKYPRHAGPLFQTYNDLALAQQWSDVRPLDLPGSARAALSGRRPNAAGPSDEPVHVVPCSVSESLSSSWIRGVFADLSTPDALYLAITTDDASLVYYKVSRGIVKPPL